MAWAGPEARSAASSLDWAEAFLRVLDPGPGTLVTLVLGMQPPLPQMLQQRMAGGGRALASLGPDFPPVALPLQSFEAAQPGPRLAVAADYAALSLQCMPGVTRCGCVHWEWSEGERGPEGSGGPHAARESGC